MVVDNVPSKDAATVLPVLRAEVGVAMITPANSAPDIQGRGGWCWYLPRIWRRSKKFVPAAWMRIRYLVGEGWGFGSVVTLSSSGPET